MDQSFGLPTGSAGEHRLNLGQIHAIDHLFNSNPSIQAARTVLVGQLISGGISLRKNGSAVKLTSEFQAHLDEHWLAFAQQVVDSFLKFGFVCCSYEQMEDDVRRAALLRKKRKLDGAPPLKGRSAAKSRAAESDADIQPPLTVPIVPPLSTFEVAYRYGGRVGYLREYYVYANVPGAGTRPDEEARVVVRQHPDDAGNVNSPMAAVFDQVSMISAFNELALVAEASRARPRITTQMRKKDGAALDPGALFYDSESRAVQSGADADDSATQARALQLQQALCRAINVVQTKAFPQASQMSSSFSGAGAPGGKAPLPSEAQPSLFVVPKDQEVAPAGSTPESRGDLESLTRLSVEQIGAAFGVPSDLIFSGRFASKATSQLSLLNTTVAQLAKAVNSVLTLAYRDIYAESASDDVGVLELLTSPLSSSDEVLALYTGGLVPLETAMRASMHNLGASNIEIEAAVEQAKEKREQEEKESKSAENFAKRENELNLEMKKADLKAKKASNAASTSKQSSISDAAAASAGSSDS